VRGMTALHGAVSTFVEKTKDKTVHIPTPNFPHINWYTVGACLIVAAFVMAFFKKNKLVVMFAAGAVVAIALKLKGH
jgi:hypothetical protein